MNTILKLVIEVYGLMMLLLIAGFASSSESIDKKKSDLIGKWENDPSGTLIDFYYDNDRLMLARYQFTSISMILEQVPFAPSQNDLESIEVSDGKLMIEQHVYNKTDRSLKIFPEKPGTPLENFDVFTETFRQFYAFFGIRGLDWESVVKEFRVKISSESRDPELFQIFKEMASILRDNHVAIAKGLDEESEKYFQFNLSPSFERQLMEDRAKEAKYEDLNLSDYVDFVSKEAVAVISEEYILNVQNDPSKKVIWGLLRQDSRIGYLNILSMENNPEDLELVLDNIINFFNEHEVSALIFDVRFNQGGDDKIALAIASRFADSSHLVLTKQPYYNGGILGPKRSFYVEAGDKGIWDLQIPKVLLISPVTASAAETFVLAMSSMPNLTRIGESTMGILSDQFARKLPNGWFVMLSNEVVLTPEGKSFEAIGIAPHIEANFPLIAFSLLKQDIGIDIAFAYLREKLAKICAQ